MGFAFDGDADRCLAVDEKGNVIDGDKILYICGRYMKENGSLGDTKVVTTIMSNLGLYEAFDAVGIGYEKTAVGDKYVYETMRSGRHLIGGEQSGHIIFSKHSCTGDGLITALKLAETVLDKKMPLSKLAGPVKTFPQVLKNVTVSDKVAVMRDKTVLDAAVEAEMILGNSGRVLLRPRCTEPIIRVMVEAPTGEICDKCADMIVGAMADYISEG